MPSYSPEKFSEKVNQLAEKAKKDAEDVAEDFTKAIFLAIIEGTPVGMPESWTSPPPAGYVPGKAKANWNPSIGAPDYSITESRRSSSTRINEISGRIAGNVAYLTNALPYVYVLEKGRHMGSDGRMKGSLQQPSGWVERTIRSADAILTRTIRQRN